MWISFFLNIEKAWKSGVAGQGSLDCQHSLPVAPKNCEEAG